MRAYYTTRRRLFPLPRGRGETGRHTLRAGPRDRQRLRGRGASRGRARRGGGAAVWTLKRATFARPMNQITITGEERSEERRVGKECVSTFRSRWWRYN